MSTAYTLAQGLSQELPKLKEHLIVINNCIKLSRPCTPTSFRITEKGILRCQREEADDINAAVSMYACLVLLEPRISAKCPNMGNQ